MNHLKIHEGNQKVDSKDYKIKLSSHKRADLYPKILFTQNPKI